MHKFEYSKSWQKALTADTVALMTKLHEYKGQQIILDGSLSETLSRFSEAAKIKSAEAAFAIDGAVTSEERLKKIVAEKTNPCNETEREIAGYRDVFSAVSENYAYLPFKPHMFLQLHQDLYKHDETAASAVPQAVDDLCTAYEKALNDGEADPLIIIPMAIVDFMCINPFEEGCRRLSRLLALLLLCRAGYMVGKYISLERLIRQSSEEYFLSLRKSFEGWQDNQNDYLPFIRYFLGVVLTAYRELFEGEELLKNKGASKPERVEAVIKNASGRITKTEILKRCPAVSEVTVQRTLAELLKNGNIIKIGGGRYTQYLWNGEKQQ